MEGFIKIHRNIKEHWIWQDPKKLKWLLDILLSVNSKPGKVNVGMQVYDCGRGQAIRSLGTWASQWGVQKDTARNFLDLLEREGIITRENLKTPHENSHNCPSKFTRSITRLTVCNFDIYQGNLHDSPPITGQQLYTNNNTITIDKIDSNSIVQYCYSGVDFSFVDARFQPDFFRWLAHKKNRSNYTYPVEELRKTYSKLLSLSENSPQKAAEVVGQAVRNNWTDLYPLRQSGAYKEPQEQLCHDPRYDIGTTL